MVADVGEQPDHLRICNEVFRFVEMPACGRDRNITIEMKALPPDGSLDEALAAYFEAYPDRRNGEVRPAAWWHIQARPLAGPPAPALVPLIDEWLFTFPWTEALLGADEMVRSNAANHIAHLVLSTVGAGAVIHDVRVAPPMWYATYWRDVAIEGPNGRFLLSAQFDD